MSIKIINYSDIKNLKNHKEYDLIKNTLHVCAISHMAKGMYKKYGQDFNAPILTIDKISQNIFKEWDDDLYKLKQYTVITQCIKEIEKYDINYLDKENIEKYTKSLRRNQKDVLESIRNLIECNVDLEKFIPETEQEKLFIDIWKNFKKSEVSSSISEFRERFFEDKNNEEYIKSALMESIEEIIENSSKELKNLRKSKENNLYKILELENILDTLNEYKATMQKQLPEKIVFHGFYYIKPIHDRFIQIVEKLGIEVIFLNWNDQRYTKKYESINDGVFEIWDESFSDYYYSKDIEVINDDNSIEYRMCDLFASIYKGDISDDSKNKINKLNEYEVEVYDKSIDFINGYKDNEIYYSDDNHKLNELLKDYYPEKYKKRHFLSYPIGQFIFLINNILSENVEDIKIDLDVLNQIFSSGFLNIKKHYKSINAVNYIHDLYMINPYMKGCNTIKLYKERLDYLIKIKIENNEQQYNVNNIDFNPMNKFSFFKVSEIRLEDMLNLVEELERIILYLKESNYSDRVSINEYLDRLLNLINQIEVNVVCEEEQDIINNLKIRLSKRLEKDIVCMQEDISEAITLLLRGNFENEENSENDIVTSIKSIEASPLLYDDKVIHICQMSEEYMKCDGSSYTWPLNSKNIDRLIKNSDDNAKRLLNRMKIINDKKDVINKYLFYCMLDSSSNIKISWIKNIEDKSLEKSLYVNLLNIWTGRFRENEYKKDNHQFYESNIKQQVLEDRLKDITDRGFKLRNESKEEYDICYKRFYYSHILNDCQEYFSDFHHKFLFTSVARYNAYVNKNNTLYEFNKLKDKFPQWNNIEKKQLEEYVGNYIPKNDMKYKNQVCIIQYNSFVNKNNRYNYNKCIYCPHTEYCNEVENYIYIKK